MEAELAAHDGNLAVHLYQHGQLVGGAMGGVPLPNESEDGMAVQQWCDRFVVGLEDEASLITPSVF